MRRGERVKLPNLHHHHAFVGTIYGKDSRVLTITRWAYYKSKNWLPNMSLFQLADVSKNGKWRKTDVQHKFPALAPVLVCDDSYLYIIGGINNNNIIIINSLLQTNVHIHVKKIIYIYNTE